MEKISVIIPIYNVEKYLERCVASVLSQTYTNTEIILVDDGSPDDCPVLCDEYAAKDSRIRVIHKQNGGLSDARNAGLAIAAGELVAFIDSDDWVEPGYLEYMYRAMKKTGADIVECLSRRTEGGETAPELPTEPGVTVFSPQDAIAQLISDRIFHQTVWNKLYRHEVIKDILFPVGKYNEDEFWTYKVFARAGRITKLDAVLYDYYRNSSSIMGRGYKLKRLDAIEAKLERQLFISENYPELSGISGTNLVGSIIYAGQMTLLYLSEAEKSEALAILLSALKQRRSHGFAYEGPLKHKIWYYLAEINLTACCRLRNLLGMNI